MRTHTLTHTHALSHPWLTHSLGHSPSIRSATTAQTVHALLTAICVMFSGYLISVQRLAPV